MDEQTERVTVEHGIQINWPHEVIGCRCGGGGLDDERVLTAHLLAQTVVPITHKHGDSWPTVETVDMMLRQVKCDRSTPYWSGHPHEASLDGAEAWLLSLRDHLRGFGE